MQLEYHVCDKELPEKILSELNSLNQMIFSASKDLEEKMSTETTAAVAIRKNGTNIEIMAPYGLEDLFEMRVRPTSLYSKGLARHTVYIDRLKHKKWQDTWNNYQ